MTFFIILALIIGLLVWLAISEKLDQKAKKAAKANRTEAEIESGIESNANTSSNMSIAGFVFVAALFFAFIGFFVITIVLFAAPKTYSVASEDRTELKALTLASNNPSNSFFLGNTYEGSSRVINYIAQENDGEETWSVVSSTPAENARIFEDETKSPYLMKTVFVYDNPWVLPWTFGTDRVKYDFHVPENSVVENFKVEN